VKIYFAQKNALDRQLFIVYIKWRAYLDLMPHAFFPIPWRIFMRPLSPKFIMLIALSALFSPCTAQPPDTLWTRSYGGSSWDLGFEAQQTTDGGYIVVGYTISYGAGEEDVYLIKTDGEGNRIWQRTYGGYSVDRGYSVKPTADGGYIIAGYSYSFGGNSDVYLIKTNANGEQIWQHTLGRNSYEEGRCVQLTSDGGYIIVGRTHPYGSGNYDVYLVKADADGNLTWQRSLGGFAWNDEGWNVQQTTDGGYIIVGFTGSFGMRNIYLIKTDAAGNTIWEQAYGGELGEYGYGVRQTTDGGYIITGCFCANNEGVGDLCLIKTDASGTMLWNRIYGGSGYDFGYSVQQTTDGGYIIAGGSNNAAYLVKTDSNGDQIWQRTFGGTYSEIGMSVQQTTDGGYVIAGTTYSYSAPEAANVYLVKTDSGGYALDLTFDLNPVGLPITIPANGGSFNFNPIIINNGPAQAPFFIWSRIRNPNGSYTPPILGPLTRSLPVGLTISVQMTQNIPATWPAGQYYYIGYTGWVVNYPAAATDSFAFTKSTLSDGNPWVTDSTCTGESFSGEEFPPLLRGDRGDLVAASPNPFNPTTALSFKLQASSFVSLNVYDIAGRIVATLANGWREAGNHEVTFDGSNLPSGVYLVRLTAGEFTAVQKMVLLK
jgi:hypothetical protein